MSGEFSLIVPSNAGAAADLRASVGRIVDVAAVAGGAGRVALATANSVHGFGVLVDAETLPAQGQRVNVCILGRCEVILGAAFTPGTTAPYFTSDGAGAAVPAAAGQFYIGRLILQDGAVLAAGDRVPCVVHPGELET